MQSEVGDRVGAMFSLTLASIGAILLSMVNALLVGISALILSIFFLSQGHAVRGGNAGVAAGHAARESQRPDR